MVKMFEGGHRIDLTRLAIRMQHPDDFDIVERERRILEELEAEEEAKTKRIDCGSTSAENLLVEMRQLQIGEGVIVEGFDYAQGIPRQEAIIGLRQYEQKLVQGLLSLETDHFDRVYQRQADEKSLKFSIRRVR
ncbi:MAG: hypothetical protein KKF56_04195 [Nanoarchaeota archaeon]|nr:hypothetical protein [Nanoarchaeota archaeon]